MDKLYSKAMVEVVDNEKLFVASDGVTDRQGEIIDQEGWDLKNFKLNPVIQWAHDSTEPAIATADKIGFRTVNGKKKLVYTPIFHRKTPMSNYIADLVDEGIIKASSVGFKPLDMVENTYTKTELLEISFVNVPANQNALSLALSKGYDEKLIKTVMPEIDLGAKTDHTEKIEKLEDKLKELNENVDKISKDMSEYLASQSKEKGAEGRDPKQLLQDRKSEVSRLAIKSLNKIVEVINKNMKG